MRVFAETSGHIGIARRARDILGWEPMVRLHEGLTRTIAYFDRLLGQGTDPTLPLPMPGDMLLPPISIINRLGA
jgi:UDP-glucuronate decarboxylase